MKKLKFMGAIIIIALSTLSFQTVFAAAQNIADVEKIIYKFSYRGHSSKKITNESDFAIIKAAEYAIGKKHTYFVIVENRKYDAAAKAKQKATRFGTNISKRPKPKTELTIECFNEDPSLENSHNALNAKQDIKDKYSD